MLPKKSFLFHKYTFRSFVLLLNAIIAMICLFYPSIHFLILLNFFFKSLNWFCNMSIIRLYYFLFNCLNFDEHIHLLFWNEKIYDSYFFYNISKVDIGRGVRSVTTLSLKFFIYTLCRRTNCLNVANVCHTNIKKMIFEIYARQDGLIFDLFEIGRFFCFLMRRELKIWFQCEFDFGRFEVWFIFFAFDFKAVASQWKNGLIVKKWI